jgi:hypothetical protein
MASAKIVKQMEASKCTDKSCKADRGGCYAGQWTIHAPHHETVYLPRHLGGGTKQTHCPGRTASTILK